MVKALSRAFFGGLASSRTLKTIASRYGMRRPRSFARRFIAGETVDEALAAARQVEARGLLTTLDYLGEGVRTPADAESATRACLAVIERIATSDVGRNLSLKLTQLGLTVDRATAVDNLRRILEPAQAGGFFVRIDMEESSYADVTLDILETIWEQGYRNVGAVLQSYLYRSEQDVARLNRLGMRVRLVKGAYSEPRRVAFQRKADVDAAFVRLAEVLLAEGAYPAIATHDPALIDATRRAAAARGVARDGFEFQMLYGIRRDLQAGLVRDGYRVRVYIPFGTEWYPYFMRRLGERPANVLFVLRSLLRERSIP